MLGLALALLAGPSPATAKVVVVDPALPPPLTLPAAEAAKLATLQGAAFVPLETDVSPDDAVVGTAIPGQGSGFLDLRTGALTPVNPEVFGFSQLSEARWRDSQTLVFIGSGPGGPVLVSVNRSTGAVASTPLALPAYPVSLSPKGGKLLLVRLPGAAAGPAGAAPSARSIGPGAQASADPTRSPFDLQLKRSPFKNVGPAIFDADSMHTTQVASAAIQLAVLDLASGVQQTLLDLPPW